MHKCIDLLKNLRLLERLKDNIRHCYASGARKESIADHSWRFALMANWISDEFPDADMNKVIRMCLIHDIGEAFTGNIPTFQRASDVATREVDLLFSWVDILPNPYSDEVRELYREMIELKTIEAKIYKALDYMEAVIVHNESDLSTWHPNEYKLQLTYGYDKVAFSPYLLSLRNAVRDESLRKIESETIK